MATLQLFHRLTNFGKDLYRSPSPAINLTLPSPSPNYVPKHFYKSFKCFQGWWLNHFPGCPVLMLDNTLGGARLHHSLCSAHFFHCASLFCSELWLIVEIEVAFFPHLQCNVRLTNSRLHCCTIGSTKQDHSASEKEHEHCPLEVPCPPGELFLQWYCVYLPECAAATMWMHPILVSLDAASALSTWIVGFQ